MFVFCSHDDDVGNQKKKKISTDADEKLRATFSPFSRAPTATRMTGTPQCLRRGRSLGAKPFRTCWKASLSVTEYLMTRMSACSRTFRTLAQSLSNRS